MLDTELRLISWRDGSTQAERLAAAALKLSGFEEIDPQAPLGGPDGTKDIICRKGGLSWIGAVYFPTGPVRFTAVKTKFKNDLAGATADHKGFAFVTNQALSPTQRRTLSKLATDAQKEVEILHLERLRALLDSPSGYGVRIQFLRIQMTLEEQLSWFSESGSQISTALTTNTRELLALRAMIDRLSATQTQIADDQSEIMRTLSFVTPSKLATPDLLSGTSFVRTDTFSRLTANLDVPLVLLVHRLTCFDLLSRHVGTLRITDVWIGSESSPTSSYKPMPSSKEVPKLLTNLCDDWRKQFPNLVKATEDDQLTAIARFHAKLLAIHPFADGNGRAGRAILMQQCLDLFSRADMSIMDKGAAYYSSLAAADREDFRPLVRLLKPVING